LRSLTIASGDRSGAACVLATLKRRPYKEIVFKINVSSALMSDLSDVRRLSSEFLREGDERDNDAMDRGTLDN